MKKSLAKLDTVCGVVNRWLRDNRNNKSELDWFSKRYRQIHVFPKEIENIFHASAVARRYDGNRHVVNLQNYKGHMVDIFECDSRIMFVFMEKETPTRAWWSREHSTDEAPFWYRNTHDFDFMDYPSNIWNKYSHGAKAHEQNLTRGYCNILQEQRNKRKLENQAIRDAVSDEWKCWSLYEPYSKFHYKNIEEMRMRLKCIILWIAIHAPEKLSTKIMEHVFEIGYYGDRKRDKDGTYIQYSLRFWHSPYKDKKSISIISRLFYEALEREKYLTELKKREERNRRQRERTAEKKKAEQFFANMSFIGAKA